MSLNYLTENDTIDKKTRKDYQRTFRKKHPEYYKNYMRERRKREVDKKIQENFDILFGEN